MQPDQCATQTSLPYPETLGTSFAFLPRVILSQQAIGSRRFCKLHEQFAHAAGEGCHPVRMSHPIPNECSVIHSGIRNIVFFSIMVGLYPFFFV